MAVSTVTGRIPKKENPMLKHRPHIEACPFCGSFDLVLWDNREEVKEARTKPQLIEGYTKPVIDLPDYCAGIICNSCGANVKFDYGTPDWPHFPDTADEACEWVADSWNRRDTGMTFFEYMMKFLEKDSPSGDLARDMNRDKANFPRANTRDEIMKYLYVKGACNDCIDTFMKCYKRYEQYRQRHHKEAE